MTQLPIDLPTRPDLSGHTWLAFTADQDEAAASRTFQTRYGRPPEYIVDVPGRTPAFSQIWLGPVPEQHL